MGCFEQGTVLSRNTRKGTRNMKKSDALAKALAEAEARDLVTPDGRRRKDREVAE